MKNLEYLKNKKKQRILKRIKEIKEQDVKK